MTTLQGPGGTAPAAFGEVVSFAVLNDASPKTKELITYMMSDGYVDWLKIAPEGKVPTRLGTANNPTEYTDAWAKLEAGVDKKALLSDIYPADVLQAVAQARGPLIAGAFLRAKVHWPPPSAGNSWCHRPWGR